MRIPIGDEQKGVISISKYDRNNGWFIPDTSEWSYDYHVRNGGRKATYKEFRELYPFKTYYQYNRCKTKTKDNSKYN